jgi:chemotaxis protein methyltransferase WspC
MTQKAIEALLEQRIGLSPESLGGETVLKAVARRMKQCGLSDPVAYLTRLSASQAEWEALLELVVVPETWFFRNKESFAFLTRHIRTEWPPEDARPELRVLSVPCASGEEPYSIAMALADTGLDRDRLQIEAMDISLAALEKARQGVYGPEAFRGKTLSFRDRYFEPVPGGHRIDPSVKRLVRFQRANLMDQERFAGLKPYDVIFCRNLLIYLSDQGKERVLTVLDRLLKPGGLLFVGHVERSLIRHPDFQWIKQPGVFACRRIRGRSAPGPAGREPRPLRRSIRPAIQRPPAAPPVTEAGSGRNPPPPPPSSLSRPPVSEPRPPSPPDRVAAVEDYLEKAQRMADQGKMEEAFRLCEKSVGENAFHIQAHFLMGLICHAMDDEERAEEAFNKAVYLDPAHHEAMSHLAFIMEHRGERDRAERMRRRAQRIREKGEEM